MPRMGNPFFGGTSGLLSANPSLGPLAALIGGGSMSNMSNMSSLLSGAGAGGAMGGLMSQSNMLQKCKLLEFHEKQPFYTKPTLIVNAVTMDWMQGMLKHFHINCSTRLSDK